MSFAKTERILRRRGQWASIEQYLAGKCAPLPKTFHDDSTVSDFLRGPATVGRTPAAPSLEDYERAPSTTYPESET